MKRLNEYINETVSDNQLSNLRNNLINHFEDQNLTNINLFNLPIVLVKRLLPYLIEDIIKKYIHNEFKYEITNSPEDYEELLKGFVDGNYKEWYDFKTANNYFEIKAFLKDTKYQDVIFSSNQVKNKDLLNVIFVEYIVEEKDNKITKIHINDISIEKGITLYISNGHLTKGIRANKKKQKVD